MGKIIRLPLLSSLVSLALSSCLRISAITLCFHEVGSENQRKGSYNPAVLRLCVMVLTRENGEKQKLQHSPDSVIDEFTVEECPLDEDTTCGFGPFRGAFLQKMATKNVYVTLYGVVGLVSSAQWAYFNGTINTMEKRFKIPSKILGFMNFATNSSQLFMSIILSYWAGRSNRPRWIALSLVTSIVQMVITLLPHLIYGVGEEELMLTEEYVGAGNSTFDVLGEQKRQLCHADEVCSVQQGSMVQPALLLLARFVGGLGGGLFHTVGLSYIDDNVEKSESPFLISLTFFFRMMGPTLGYAIASVCLKIYNAPFLTPTITPDDPRWIGAWWLGWIILIIITSVTTFPMGLFPKVLPESALRRKKANEAIVEETPPSLKDLIVTSKRLLKNKLFLFNNAASIMYIIGETPYWIFLTKYMETEYHQSASFSNFITGTMGIVTSATGMIIAGMVISRFRPSARALSAWNAAVGLMTLLAFISFIFIHCDSQVISDGVTDFNATTSCNLNCECEFAPYAPVCSDENETFISACHAGCKNVEQIQDEKIFTQCGCVNDGHGSAKAGSCPKDCTWPLWAFIGILCIVRTASAAAIASNVLVGVRCMEERDKSAGLGLGLTIRGVLGFVPGPVIYGYILDSTCIVWGKTCEGKGNCWMYDGPSLAYVLNLTSSFFLLFATMFDVAFWHNSKELKIFD